MLNVNTTKITIVDETRECLSRQVRQVTTFSTKSTLNSHDGYRSAFHSVSQSTSGA